MDATRAVAAAMGARLRAVGIDVDLAPVVDVNADPENPVIGVRSFGATPDLVARHGAAFVRGLQGAGVAACAKHFPGHGSTHTDSHLALPTVADPVEVLRERDLAPFAAVVDAGVRCIMNGALVEKLIAFEAMEGAKYAIFVKLPEDLNGATLEADKAAPALH